MTRESMEAAGRLNGWKEIADYLGRSVRSVQRWENELCLPVHRLKTRNGQVVYAYRAELGEWLERSEVQRELGTSAAPTDGPDTGTPTPGPDAPPAIVSGVASDVTEPVSVPEAPSIAARAVVEEGPHAGLPAVMPAGPTVVSEAVAPVAAAAARPKWREYVWLGATAAALLVGVLIGRGAGSASGATATTVHIEGRVIEGHDRAGRLVWRHDVGHSVRSTQDRPPTGEDGANTDSVALEDIDGDGTSEFLVPVRSGDGRIPASTDRLMAFGEDGRLRWSVAPEFSVQCGDRTFRGPWELRAVAVSRGPGPKRVWASYVDSLWWPSFVIEIDPAGQSRTRLFQSGWVLSLGELDTPAGPRLVAGGVLNEHARASLTVVDLQGPPTVVKASAPEFQCRMDGQVPDRVHLLPSLEMTGAMGLPYRLISRLRTNGADLLWEDNYGHAVGYLGVDGRISEFLLTDMYWHEHEGASRFAVKHMPRDCPERKGPYEIREWTAAGGWGSYAVSSGAGRQAVAEMASNQK
ncbi:hypothetical protein [Luteitalea sp. TBR-22]|uniref:hypothetical protein n=1 Tax=Luteitalea sp. TBR-22 TaxID=2802971 RepID=UPI001EF3F2A9|nr:hypothetical protein [Luteitalea sp. TBR-22]